MSSTDERVQSMRLLVVCQYYYPEPFAITDICEELVRRGHRVTVLTGLPNYPEGRVPDEYRHGAKRTETRGGVEIIRTFEIGRGQGTVRRLANYVSYCVSASLRVLSLGSDLDAVLVYQLSPVTMAAPAVLYRRLHGKPVLLYCLDLWPASLLAGGIKEGSWVYGVLLGVSRWLYRRVDGIAATSESFRGYFEQTLGVTPEKITHIPQYAEDAPSLESHAAPRALEVGRASGESRVFNFMFSGNIGRLQSVDTIICAANLLKADGRFRFHIVGDGSGLAEATALVDELGLKNVVFYGRRPLEDMPALYQQADALLVTLKDEPALSYTLPRKIQSYMSAGKPIIGAIRGETRRVIEQADCGLCCDAEDYEALAALFMRFAELDASDQMSANALAYYEEHYRRDAFFESLLARLNGLVHCESE
jgi:glycosyltransferase involved in cell wall biosynthesis